MEWDHGRSTHQNGLEILLFPSISVMVFAFFILVGTSFVVHVKDDGNLISRRHVIYRLFMSRLLVCMFPDARLSVTDGQKAIDESAVAATPATGDAPSVPVAGVKKMGGADGGGCNMADHQDGSSTGISGDSACSSSIQRSPRQVAEDLEPYVPYLGFIFYSFPVFSFTLPFGGQLKFFGYDFI